MDGESLDGRASVRRPTPKPERARRLIRALSEQVNPLMHSMPAPSNLPEQLRGCWTVARRDQQHLRTYNPSVKYPSQSTPFVTNRNFDQFFQLLAENHPAVNHRYLLALSRPNDRARDSFAKCVASGKTGWVRFVGAPQALELGSSRRIGLHAMREGSSSGKKHTKTLGSFRKMPRYALPRPVRSVNAPFVRPFHSFVS